MGLANHPVETLRPGPDLAAEEHLESDLFRFHRVHVPSHRVANLRRIVLHLDRAAVGLAAGIALKAVWLLSDRAFLCLQAEFHRGIPRRPARSG